MPNNATSDWAVKFYFLVEFQSNWDRFQTSFTEVSGLDMQLKTNEKPSDSGIWIKMPGGVEFGNITLKRPVPAKDNDTFTQWVYKCLKADKDKKVIPYDMIIKLLGQEGSPLAGWVCSHAYPVKWTLGGLNAQENGLATETIVISSNRIDRIKI